MKNLDVYKAVLAENGFAIIEDVFSDEQVEQMLQAIDKTDKSNTTFRKSANLFAIRQFLKEIPEINEVIFNAGL